MMLNLFWWGSKGASTRGINWLNWDKLSMKKKFGGIGFCNLHGFNLAMLGKQGWNLINNPHTTIYKILKNKYYPNVGFLDAKLGNKPNYTSYSIFASHILVEESI